MAYFVTGATGFIGQFLIRNLIKRRQPIYVLVRKGSVRKLEALRAQWGATDREVIPVIGDIGVVAGELAANGFNRGDRE